MTAPAVDALAIRPLQEQDLELLPVSEEAVAHMRRILERNDWTHKGVRVFVAELSTKPSESGITTKALVGYAYVGLGYPPYYPPLADDIKQMNLADINVFEPFQRRGYATQMLQFFKSEANRLGLHVFRAECEKGWLVTMYQRVGFEPVPYKGPREDYPVDSHTMLEMWLTPTPPSSSNQ